MLRRLLQLVAGAGTVSSIELAHTLDMSPALVEPMLEELARQGYLRLLTPGTAGPCERCPAHAACLSGNPARVWVLSARGQASVAMGPGQTPGADSHRSDAPLRDDDAGRTGP